MNAGSRPSGPTLPTRSRRLRPGSRDLRIPLRWRAMRRAIVTLLALVLATAASAEDSAVKHLDEILAHVDAAHLKAIDDKLASFGTRHSLSDTTSPTRGIGAARKWIFGAMSRWPPESGRHLARQDPSSDPRAQRARA